MNMWARYDEEDNDFVHFSAEVNLKSRNHRRLLSSVHVDDLELMFSEEEAKELLERLESESRVFCGITICF